jgi:hypothetical protein
VDCIFHFISIDAVKQNNFDRALFSLYPEAYDKIYELSFNNKLISGQVLPYRKSNPSILHIPYKKNYNDEINLDYLSSGIEKIGYIFNEFDFFKNMKKIGIQVDNKYEENLISERINKINIPSVQFFYKNNKNGE